jgi:hypothetical protein
MGKSKSSNLVPVYLPDNFDADKILADEHFSSAIKNNMKARMYYILDTIYHMRFNTKWSDCYEKNGGYPLHSDILNEILGKKYVEAFDILIKNGVLERTSAYKVGEHSKLVSFTYEYSNVEFIISSINSILSPTIFKKVKAQKAKEQKNNNNELKKIKHITKWFETGLLSTNWKDANAYLSTYRQEMLYFIPKVLPKNKTKDEIESRINYRTNNLLEAFTKLKAKNYMLNMTGQDHRLHSIITSIKKEARTLLTYDGKPLVSIDLKASQPFLLTYICKPEYWQNSINLDMPELAPIMRGTKFQKAVNDIHMSGNFPVNHTSKELQSSNFSSFIWENDFYQHLVDLADREKVADIFPNRSKVKKKMMMILYDDGYYKDNEPSFKLFQKWFPKEAGMIILFKKLSRKAKSKRTDGILNYLPILLQRLESRLILHQITKAIAKEIPNAPLFPVHDCILTTSENADRVKSIMTRELEFITGTKPGFTVEKYIHKKTFDEIFLLGMEDVHEILNIKSKLKTSGVNMKQSKLIDMPNIEHEG